MQIPDWIVRIYNIVRLLGGWSIFKCEIRKTNDTFQYRCLSGCHLMGWDCYYEGKTKLPRLGSAMPPSQMCSKLWKVLEPVRHEPRQNWFSSKISQRWAVLLSLINHHHPFDPIPNHLILISMLVSQKTTKTQISCPTTLLSTLHILFSFLLRNNFKNSSIK